MSRRGQSLESQAYYVLQSINLINDIDKRHEIYQDTIGEDKEHIGKKEFKEIGISQEYIFSINSMKNNLSQANKFVDFIKQEYNIKRLVDITPDMAIDYLQRAKDDGLSASSLKVIKNCILKLDSGISKCYANSNPLYTEEVRNFTTRENTTSYERTYSTEEIKSIVDYINDHSKYGDLFTVQLDLGLRVSEVCNLKGSDITIGQGETVLSRKFGEIDTSNTVRVNGKGGLVRWMPIPVDKIDFYQNLKEQGDEKIFSTDRNYIGQVFRNATQRLGLEVSSKTHEIRKCYAREELSSKVEHFTTTHGREPSVGELKELQLQVVSQLGHGRGREDLIRVYLM